MDFLFQAYEQRRSEILYNRPKDGETYGIKWRTLKVSYMDNTFY